MEKIKFHFLHPQRQCELFISPHYRLASLRVIPARHHVLSALLQLKLEIGIVYYSARDVSAYQTKCKNNTCPLQTIYYILLCHILHLADCWFMPHRKNLKNTLLSSTNLIKISKAVVGRREVRFNFLRHSIILLP